MNDFKGDLLNVGDMVIFVWPQNMGYAYGGLMDKGCITALSSIGAKVTICNQLEINSDQVYKVI
jgi:hypothetical protein